MHKCLYGCNGEEPYSQITQHSQTHPLSSSFVFFPFLPSPPSPTKNKNHILLRPFEDQEVLQWGHLYNPSRLKYFMNVVESHWILAYVSVNVWRYHWFSQTSAQSSGRESNTNTAARYFISEAGTFWLHWIPLRLWNKKEKIQQSVKGIQGRAGSIDCSSWLHSQYWTCNLTLKFIKMHDTQVNHSIKIITKRRYQKGCCNIKCIKWERLGQITNGFRGKCALQTIQDKARGKRFNISRGAISSQRGWYIHGSSCQRKWLSTIKKMSILYPCCNCICTFSASSFITLTTQISFKFSSLTLNPCPQVLDTPAFDYRSYPCLSSFYKPR